MVQDQGLDVYLAPFGNINERYQQHAVPEGSPAFTGDPNEVYIEAVDGERFIIVANLLEDLETKGATHLQFNHEIDQARDASGTTTCMSLTELERQGSKHMNLKGRHTMATTIRKVDGAWSRCGFVFAFLVMDEELDMSDDQIAQDVDMHGKIVITVERGKREKTECRDPFAAQLWDGYDAPDTKISSKRVVKDSCVSHAVNHVVLGEAPQPHWHNNKGRNKWSGLKGKMGKPIKFTIRYRSRDALQKLKIIPKDIYPTIIDLTDSPPPSPRVKQEPGLDGKHAATDTKVKREPGGDDRNAQTSVTRKQAPARPAPNNELINPAKLADIERNKKRKALQDEFEAIELHQKKMRVAQALADLENEA